METYFHYGAAIRLVCWGCGHEVCALPEQLINDTALEVDCPECETEHFFTEDADGNLGVAEAVSAFGLVLHMPNAPR